MADKKISDLTPASTLDGTEVGEVEQGGNSRKILIGLLGILGLAQSWTKPQRFGTLTAITSGTTLTILLADGNDYTLTLGHNGTLANPADIASYVGQKGSIAGVQDATGGRTLAVGSQWFPIGAATIPAIPAGANAKWRLDYHVVSATRIDFAVSSVGV